MVRIRGKDAQIQLSFSMIFTIIIIAATLGIAIYVISIIWDTTKDVECKLYWTDMQEAIDNAWAADDSMSNVFRGSVGPETTKVCFGYMNQSFADKEKTIHDSMSNFAGTSDNLFFYPRSSCSGKFSYNLKHVKTDSFFCVTVPSNKQPSVVVSKNAFEALVKLSPLGA